MREFHFFFWPTIAQYFNVNRPCLVLFPGATGVPVFVVVVPAQDLGAPHTVVPPQKSST